MYNRRDISCFYAAFSFFLVAASMAASPADAGVCVPEGACERGRAAVPGGGMIPFVAITGRPTEAEVRAKVAAIDGQGIESLPGMDEIFTLFDAAPDVRPIEWITYNLARQAVLHRGNGGLAELFACGPAGHVPATLRAVIWLCALHGIDHYVTGTATWSAEVTAPASPARLRLSTGGRVAQVKFAGRDLGVRAWAPFEWEFPSDCAGRKGLLEISISTSVMPMYGDYLAGKWDRGNNHYNSVVGHDGPCGLLDAAWVLPSRGVEHEGQLLVK